ncbi:MAG: hypothetical protein R2795_17595 [Saprospiraceae bacterium]
MDINARLLELLCLYETKKQYDRMSYRLISFGRSVVKSHEASPLQLKTHKMLRALLQLHPNEDKHFFRQYTNAYKEMLGEPRERLFLKYLDVLGWLESKS